MATLAQESKPDNTRTDKKVDGFSGLVRTFECFGLEKGDEFTFPNTFEVYEQKFRDRAVQYIIVELTNGKTKQFYPSTLTKSRLIYAEDGTSTGERAYTKGTAAELFRQHKSVQEGMDALRGKTVRVTEIEYVKTLRFGTNELMTSHIPTIDIIS